jgi:hypothetical protein
MRPRPTGLSLITNGPHWQAHRKRHATQGAQRTLCGVTVQGYWYLIPHSKGALHPTCKRCQHELAILYRNLRWRDAPHLRRVS